MVGGLGFGASGNIGETLAVFEPTHGSAPKYAGPVQGEPVYPRLSRIRECSRAVAMAVIRRAVAEGHADGSILTDLETTLGRAMWFPDYLPIRYEPAARVSGQDIETVYAK